MSNASRSKALQSVGMVLGLAVIAWLFYMPVHGNKAEVTTWTLLLTSVALAVNWNLTGGFTGYVDFGHAVWFGIGGYVSMILITPRSSLQAGWVPENWPIWPSIILGALAAGLVANIVGRFTLKLSGAYFSIAMLGFFVFMREVVRVSKPITNGGTSLDVNNLEIIGSANYWYYIQLSLVIALVAFSWWLRRTRFGSSLVAIREDEIGAEMRGINTTRNKVWVFTFSAFSTGLFGGMVSFQGSSIEPDTAFIEVRTIDAVMGSMLGGLGSVMGPVLGMTVLYLLRNVLWANLLDYHLLAQGVLLASIVLFLPKGIIGLFGGQTGNIRKMLGMSEREGSRTSTFDGMESSFDEDGNIREGARTTRLASEAEVEVPGI